MGKKSIKKNMIMNTVLTVSNFIFPLITYGYVARILTPDGTGQVAFVDSILAYFLYIASLGIPAYGRREIAKVRNDKNAMSKVFCELFGLNAAATLLSCVLLWIVVFSVPKLHAYLPLFLIMSAQIVLKLIGVEWLYQGIEEYSYIAIRSLIFKTISVFLTFILIRSREDVLWYGFVHIFTNAASYICNFYNLRKYINPKICGKPEMRQHIKPILVLFTASIAITISANFDISMLGFISTEVEVGLYNAALKIKGIVLSLSTAIVTVLVPRMSYYFARNENEKIISLLTKSVRVSLLVSIPVAVYTFVFSENVLFFIGGEQYVPAANVLRILMACVLALILTNLFGVQILIPMGKEKCYSQSILIAMIIKMIFNWLLLPTMGAIGATVGTLITESWNAFYMGRGCLSYVKSIFSRISFLRYVIPLLVAAVISYFAQRCLPGLIVFWQLVVTTVAFFGVYYALNMALKEPLMTEAWLKIKGKLGKKLEVHEDGANN